MVAHDENFVRGVAMVLRGESMKASSYVTHGPSLGVLREKMVASFVRHATPERYAVDSGLVHHHQDGSASRQCDLLVHEPAITAPLYQWEDFVVVRHTAARAVLEVKSNLQKKGFKELLDVHESLMRIEKASCPDAFIPTFAYALEGVRFRTFLKYVQKGIAENPLGFDEPMRCFNLPVCVAVQAKSYVGVRATICAAGMPIHYCAVNLSVEGDDADEPPSGLETGYFLEIYTAALDDKRDTGVLVHTRGIHPSRLYSWFNDLEVAANRKFWITADGTINKGKIP